MKRILLSLCLLAGIYQANAQVIWSQNFDSFAQGDLSATTDGSAPGQGGIYALNGTPGDFQIMDFGTPHNNILYIFTGPSYSSTSSDNNRYVIYDDVPAPAAGNTYIKGSFDIYTGNAGGLGKGHLTLFSDTSAIAGIGYNNETKVLIGTGYMSLNGSAGYWHVTLTGSNVSDATWIRVGFVYNRTTGQIDWVTPFGTYNMNNNATHIYYPNLLPEEAYIVAQTNANNFGSSDFAFDNINVEYSNDATLNLNETPTRVTGVKVYPNPTTDILKISAKSKVDAIEIYDMSGKKVEAQLRDNEVNVESLTPGTYLIYVITKDGKTLTKFIKN